MIPIKNFIFNFFDRIGISVSFLCAIHCTVLPLLFPLLSLTGIAFIWDPFFEFSLIGIALLVGIPSLLLSYFRVHRNRSPLILFNSGIIILLLYKYFHVVMGYGHTGNVHSISMWDLLVILFAAGLIIIGHYLNFRFSRTCPVSIETV